MINNFTNYKGKYFDLSQIIVKDTSKFSENDNQFCNKAKIYSEQNHESVFYSAKHIKDGVFDYAQYFTIPVSPKDIEQINQTYSDNHVLGIFYTSDYTPEYQYKRDITGYQYEYECAEYLKSHGFTDVEVTKGSGDQGIDIIANKDGLKYGIQCKLYKNPVSNKAIQEVYTGASFYGCDVAVVMTNSTFTESAKELAHKIGVKLWSSD